MKRLLLYVGILLMLVGAGVSVGAQESNRAGEIKALEQRRTQAMMNADVATLESLFDSTMTYTHSNGLVQGRRQLIDMLVSGDVVYRSIKTDELAVREFGATVVVTGKQVIELTAGGKPLTSKSRFTAVYVGVGGDGGHARLIAYQSTPLPKLTLEEKK